jgi:hypothetical protein
MLFSILYQLMRCLLGLTVALVRRDLSKDAALPSIFGASSCAQNNQCHAVRVPLGVVNNDHLWRTPLQHAHMIDPDSALLDISVRQAVTQVPTHRNMITSGRKRNRRSSTSVLARDTGDASAQPS